MLTVHKTPQVRATTRAAAALDAELLAIPVFEDDDLTDVPELDRASGGEIGRARDRGELRGKPCEVFTSPLTEGGWKAARVALIGVGQRKDCALSVVRRFATVAGLTARQHRLETLAILARAPFRRTRSPRSSQRVWCWRISRALLTRRTGIPSPGSEPQSSGSTALRT
jgi:hypothetical protein